MLRTRLDREASSPTIWIPAFAGTSGELGFYTYIVASRRNGTIYVGMTDNLAKRIYEHRAGLRTGFTKTYGVKILVWYEVHDGRETAFRRERQIKEWRRSWKLRLIEDGNPTWADLYETLNC